MLIPIELSIRLKEGVTLVVVLHRHNSDDTKRFKVVASLLADLALVVEQWQAVHGSVGVPRSTPHLTEKQRKAVER